MRQRPELAVAALVLMAACSGQPTEQKDATEPFVAASFYQSDIAPLLRTRCVSCHMTGTEAGKLKLAPNDAVRSLVGVKSGEAPALTLVVPGKPDDSYLVMKLEGTHLAKGGSGVRMPFGQGPLSAEDLGKVRKWISEGASE